MENKLKFAYLKNLDTNEVFDKNLHELEMKFLFAAMS